MIRDATPADAAAIAAIWNPVISDTAITFNSVEKSMADIAAMIRARQADGHGFLVAEAEGNILGFATYAQFRGGVGYARTMEHTILLSPAAQGRGLGRALMTAVEDHARARGALSLFAGVSAENPAGRAFHAAMGFAEVAILQRVGYKFGRTMDLVLMQKFLA
ncbi:MAG: GNAT family N-acetyltransferase [Rhodobacteraceae bacterium]|nr:GNAT family N-acetyltransferase [Paracoccaceae bacterium]